MPKMSRKSMVLSYRDSLLREGDVNLLRGPYWLNDTIISFYFDYLEHERYQSNPLLLFVSPEVTQCIKMMPVTEIAVFLDPLLESGTCQFIFFALNDNQTTETSGGSHWSLLVLSLPERMIFHYDSSRGTNEFQAMDLSQKLLLYFGLPEGRYQEVSCLQQDNGYDCGVHLLCNTEQLATFALHCGMIQGCLKITPEEVRTKRTQIMKIIEHLQQKR